MSFSKEGILQHQPVPGYPYYAPSEDIYIQAHEEKNMNPEDVPSLKSIDETDTVGTHNKNSVRDTRLGGNLDVPGSELDDAQENIGNEDEENNYYSLGGDDHNNLDETKD